MKIATVLPCNIHQYLLLRGRTDRQTHSIGEFMSIEKMLITILLKNLAFISKPLEPSNILPEWKICAGRVQYQSFSQEL